MKLVVIQKLSLPLILAAALCLCLSARPFTASAQERYTEEISYSAWRGERPYRDIPISGDTLSLAKRFYFGAGGSYNLRSEGDEIDLLAIDYWGYGGYSCPISPSFRNGFGWNIKAGYFFSEYIALEASFHQHLKYKMKGDYFFTQYFLDEEDYIVEVDDVYAQLEGEVRGVDILLNGKIVIPGGNVRPYGVMGLGYIRLEKEWDALAEVLTTFYDTGEWRVGETVYHDSEKNSGVLFRIGAGAAYFITDNLGLEAELAYNKGFGDVDEVSFFTLNLGALVAF